MALQVYGGYKTGEEYAKDIKETLQRLGIELSCKQ